MSFSANSTGGNYNHTHTYGLINSDWYGTIPGVGILNKDGTYKRGTKISTVRNESVVTSATATKTGACTQYTMSAEVSETSTLPPYISVYFWRRTV